MTKMRSSADKLKNWMTSDLSRVLLCASTASLRLTIVLPNPHQMSQKPITYPHDSLPTTTEQNQLPQPTATVQNLATHPRRKIQNLASRYKFQHPAPWSKQAATTTAVLLSQQITVLCCPVLLQTSLQKIATLSVRWAFLGLVKTVPGPNVDTPSQACLITPSVFCKICLKIQSCCCHENRAEMWSGDTKIWGERLIAVSWVVFIQIVGITDVYKFLVPISH